jgi:heme-degrading monooxygenase HmoA
MRCRDMMTVITYVTVREGAEPEWDAAMRERLDSARGRAGWLKGQLLIPLDGLNKRVIVGTWRSRGDWEAWHQDPAFEATRTRLEGLQAEPSETAWYEVVVDRAASTLRDSVEGAAAQVKQRAKAVADRLSRQR